MNKYIITAITEAVRLNVKGRTVVLSLLALYGAIIVLPFYVLFQLSVVLGLLPLWLLAKIRKFVARRTSQQPFVGV